MMGELTELAITIAEYPLIERNSTTFSQNLMSSSQTTIACEKCSAENPAGRKFCGECGTSLYKNCPSCGESVSVAENFCGNCGKNIREYTSELVDQATDLLAKGKLSFENLDFDLALVFLGKALKIQDLKTEHIVAEAAELVERVKKAKEDVRNREADLIEQAQNAQDKDPGRALKLISEVAEKLLSEQGRQLRVKLQTKVGEIQVLKKEIKAQLKKPNIQLLEKIERLLILDPTAENFEKVGQQIATKAIAVAKKQFDKGDVINALATLRQVPSQFTSDALKKIVGICRDRVFCIESMQKAMYVDQTLIKCANFIKEKMPHEKKLLERLPDLKNKVDSYKNDPHAVLRRWAKPRSLELEAEIAPLEFAHLFDGVEKLSPRVPFHTKYMNALGLGLSGLGVGYLELSVTAGKKGLFSGFGRKKSTVGIDIGNDSIKAVRLTIPKGSDRPQIESAVEIPIARSTADKLSEGTVGVDYIAALQQLKEKIDLSRCSIVSSTPTNQSLVRSVMVPIVENKKDSYSMVENELLAQLPYGLDEVAWSYQLLRKTEKTSSQQTLLTFAIKKVDLDRLDEVYQKADIKVTEYQPCVASTVNIWEKVRQEKLTLNEPDGVRPIGVLDLGASFSNLIFIFENELHIRTMGISGKDFTRALLSEFTVTAEDAIRWKSDPMSAPSIARLYDALTRPLNVLYNELLRTIDDTKGKQASLTPKKIFVAGGGSLLHGLVRGLHNGPQDLTI